MVMLHGPEMICLPSPVHPRTCSFSDTDSDSDCEKGHPNPNPNPAALVMTSSPAPWLSEQLLSLVLLGKGNSSLLISWGLLPDEHCRSLYFGPDAPVGVDPLRSPCTTILISKLLGLLIILAANVLKLPQILKMLSAGSTQGVSAPMYLLETFAYQVVLAYALALQMPFSSYGETWSLVAQNILVLFLMWYDRSKRLPLLLFSSFIFAAWTHVLFSRDLLPLPVLTLFRQACVVVFTLARVPQIMSNFKNGHTGQLSFLTVAMQLAGVLARVFTTFHDPGAMDAIVLIGLLLSVATNGIVLLQILWYWRATLRALKPSSKQQSRKKRD